jgi:hypothetical protein
VVYVVTLSDASSPWGTAWITQLPTLLAPKALNINVEYRHFALDPSLGLPLLLSLGYWLYHKASAPLIRTSFWLFLVAFFIAWSPFNFWQWLPHTTYILQFPYRMLVNLDWLGGLLFVPMLNQLFKNALDQRHLLLGLLLILLANSQWLKDNYVNHSPIFVHPGHPQFFFNLMTSDYLVDPRAIEVSAQSVPSEKNCRIEDHVSSCNITVKEKEQIIALPILYYPHLLEITVNGQEVPYFPSIHPHVPTL